MQKCPHCQALYSGNEFCYRCGFEYRLSLECEQIAGRYSELTWMSLKIGSYDKALQYIDQALVYDNLSICRNLKRVLSLWKISHKCCGPYGGK